MFEETISAPALANLAGVTTVMLFKYRQKPHWNGPPFTREGHSIRYALAPALVWIIERQTRPLVARIEAMEAEVAGNRI